MSDSEPDYLTQGERLCEGDRVARQLGVEIVALRPGRAVLRMTVREGMLNFWNVCHGGTIATLADIACAFACNAGNELTVGSSMAIDYLAPARDGDELTAEAVEVSRAGRNAYYDAKVTAQDGTTVALLRARCRRIPNTPTVPPSPNAG